MKTGKKILSLILVVLMLVPSFMIMSNAALISVDGAGYLLKDGNNVELWWIYYTQPTYFSVPGTITAEGNTYNVTSVAFGKYNSTVDLLETVDMSSASNLITAGGFREFPALKTVIFSDSINSLLDGICEGCKELSNVDLPDNLTALPYNAFADCTSLSEIDFPESLTTIGTAAFSNTALETVTITKNVEKIETEDIYGTLPIFKSCKSLTEINVDSENKYYSSEDGVLFNKDKTVLIRYPEGKTDKTYKVPNGVLEIAKDAFYECDNLEEIEMPDSVLKICEYAFDSCDNLKEVVLSENLKYVEANAFNSCPIEKISVLPNSLIKVSSGAFSGHKLTDVYFDGTEKEWEKIEEIVSYNYPNLGISGEIGAFSPEVIMHFKNEVPDEPEHTHSFTSGVVLEATCEDDGIMSFLCKCGQSYTDIILAKGHKDENSDYKCDNEGCDYVFEKPTPEDPTVDCDCRCHNDNFFARLIWSITNFFNKIFKKNKICDCGIAHY